MKLVWGLRSFAYIVFLAVTVVPWALAVLLFSLVGTPTCMPEALSVCTTKPTAARALVAAAFMRRRAGSVRASPGFSFSASS